MRSRTIGLSADVLRGLDPRTKPPNALDLVAELAALAAAHHDRSRGQVLHAYGGIRRVDVLATGARRSISVNAQILFIDRMPAQQFIKDDVDSLRMNARLPAHIRRITP